MVLCIFLTYHGLLYTCSKKSNEISLKFILAAFFLWLKLNKNKNLASYESNPSSNPGFRLTIMAVVNKWATIRNVITNQAITRLFNANGIRKIGAIKWNCMSLARYHATA